MSVTDENNDGGAGTANGSGSVLELTMRDKIEAALRTVFDPEIPVNIYDLGLVYEIREEDNGNVKITMTLTAPACPAAGDIVHDVQMKVEEIQGVIDCHVQLTFDPPWNKEMMTEEAKLELGFL
jgi:FeS assembly SUF system protein